MSTTVYPVPGVFLPGYPTAPQSGLTKAEADALVATGAYQHDPPPEEADQPTEDPADAGSSAL